MFKNFKKSQLLKTFASSTQLSVTSLACRICYDNEKGEELVAPCYCKGTVAYVHRSCLDTWLAESGTTNCELCHKPYRNDKTQRENAIIKLWKKLKDGSSSPDQKVRSHIIACTVITPVTITLVVYIVCMFYSQKVTANASLDDSPSDSISALTVLGIILIGYYLWIYTITRLHAKWQRSCLIKYVPRNGSEEQLILVPANSTQSLNSHNIIVTDLPTGTDNANQETQIPGVCLLRGNILPIFGNLQGEPSNFDNIVDFDLNQTKCDKKLLRNINMIAKNYDDIGNENATVQYAKNEFDTKSSQDTCQNDTSSGCIITEHAKHDDIEKGQVIIDVDGEY